MLECRGSWPARTQCERGRKRMLCRSQRIGGRIAVLAVSVAALPATIWWVRASGRRAVWNVWYLRWFWGGVDCEWLSRGTEGEGWSRGKRRREGLGSKWQWRGRERRRVETVCACVCVLVLALREETTWHCVLSVSAHVVQYRLTHTVSGYTVSS